MSTELVEVCEVGGRIVMGTPMERDAALLNPGDRIIVDGAIETVAYTWFYDGVIIKCRSGKAVFPALGGVFHRAVPGEIDG